MEGDSYSQLKRDHYQSQIKLFPTDTCASFLQNIAMDTLREFLESSTIHGLTYISTAKVREAVIYVLAEFVR